MATEGKGNCNCGSITVMLPTMPSQSLLCHCSNCRRAGSAPFTVNYYLELSSIQIQDSKGSLKTYVDSNTRSGNTIYRKFCGDCGSPVMTLNSPNAEKVILKGGLFDHMPEPGLEFHEGDKMPWMKVVKAGGEEKAKV
ncbi:hypothetical protein K505DRAFT_298129 [Melanomma pulvis-pyrius CBS 109.77]|uniref:CENP-V/GFA domain-containing protein n=1 Tax=Melanomma pulvis-pyrius CBS 109.77 TaxID=1314802 RepID=A0A6A6XMG4_9PLEO|nr:hypothetical protein K505DRAFT_298129 [Melanomma pulvis-pyrius CBS 109.77]